MDRDRELCTKAGNWRHFEPDRTVFSRGNHLNFKRLGGNSLFRNNREFQMTEQGIEMGEQGDVTSRT